MTKPLFSGLIVDENDNVVETVVVGDEPCYVVNDSGFRRHIPTEQVDRQVLALMKEQISGHEDLLERRPQGLQGRVPGGRLPAAHGLQGRREIPGGLPGGGQARPYHQHCPVR